MAALPRHECAVCAHHPHIVVAVAHRGMRERIVDLLARDHGCWVVTPLGGLGGLDDVISSDPDLIIIDAADFAACWSGRVTSVPLHHVVVIGPEPDPAFRQAVLDRGAGAWLSRDLVGEELNGVLRSALGCTHGPCPRSSRTAYPSRPIEPNAPSA